MIGQRSGVSRLIDLILVLQQPLEIGDADRVAHVSDEILQLPHVLARGGVVKRRQTAKVLLVDVAVGVQQQFHHLVIESAGLYIKYVPIIIITTIIIVIIIIVIIILILIITLLQSAGFL